jgi:hypothetical protein
MLSFMPDGDETSDAIRVGDEVVVPDGGTLPARCIKCNQPASGGPIRFTFVDSDAGAPHGLVTAAHHFTTRRKATVYLSLCARHRYMRTFIRWGCPFLILFGLAVVVYANVAYPKPPDGLVALFMLSLVGGIFPLGAYQQHYLKGRVRNGLVWISRGGEDFVWSLPSNSSIQDPPVEILHPKSSVRPARRDRMETK